MHHMKCFLVAATTISPSSFFISAFTTPSIRATCTITCNVSKLKTKLFEQGRHTSGKKQEEDNDGIDSVFYRDLQKAKAEKLGGMIPPEQAKEAAKDSENEFLQAMKETSQEFEEAKQQFGSQGAVDLFLGKIQKEDEKNGRVDDVGDDVHDVDDEEEGAFQ